MTDLNALQRYLDFFDRNHLGGPSNQPRGGQWGVFGTDLANNSGETRPGMAWALEQMRPAAQEAPPLTLADFAGLFNGSGGGGQRERPGYVRSTYQEHENPFLARVKALQETPDQPMNSYVSQLMRRTGAY